MRPRDKNNFCTGINDSYTQAFGRSPLLTFDLVPTPLLRIATAIANPDKKNMSHYQTGLGPATPPFKAKYFWSFSQIPVTKITSVGANGRSPLLTFDLVPTPLLRIATAIANPDNKNMSHYQTGLGPATPPFKAKYFWSFSQIPVTKITSVRANGRSPLLTSDFVNLIS
ncbi:MAG: hypothetical protein F6K17_11720 [Okeania sp. SIO3C4]|nr:hypothetical protein [Okeania sp. SIO3C4]